MRKSAGKAARKETIRYQVVKKAPVAAIVKLYQAGGWWEEIPGWRELVPDMVAGSFCFVLARTLKNEIVGMGRAISDGVSDAYIQDVVVLKGYRGKGIGAEIVKRLVRMCRRGKISWIGLIAEPGTKEFYHRLGFKAKSGYELMLIEAH